MPIDSYRRYRQYLFEDLKAHDPLIDKWRAWHAIKYPQVAFTRKLRTAEYFINRAHGPLSRAIALVFRLRARSAGIKLGFSIPPNVFGPGLSIAHWGTVVVNDQVRVGARCRIHPGTCLATKDGVAPTLGDDCYLGPGAKLLGGIVLGNGVWVGANAVVTRSFGEGSVLAGVPARSIGNKIATWTGGRIGAQTTS